MSIGGRPYVNALLRNDVPKVPKVEENRRNGDPSEYRRAGNALPG